MRPRLLQWSQCLAVVCLLALTGCGGVFGERDAAKSAAKPPAGTAGETDKSADKTNSQKPAIARVVPPGETAAAAADKIAQVETAKAAPPSPVPEGLFSDKARASYADEEYVPKPVTQTGPNDAGAVQSSPDQTPLASAKAAGKPAPPFSPPPPVVEAEKKASTSQEKPSGPGGDIPLITARIGEHSGYSRVVFDFENDVGYRLERKLGINSEVLTIAFDRQVRFNSAALEKKAARHFRWKDFGNTADGTEVRLQVAVGAEIRELRVQKKVVFDIASLPNAPFSPAPEDELQAQSPGAAPSKPVAAPKPAPAPRPAPVPRPAPAPKPLAKAQAQTPPPPPPAAEPNPAVASVPLAAPSAAKPGRVATIYFTPETGSIDEQGRTIVGEIAAAVKSKGGVIRLIGFPATEKSSSDSGSATAVSRMQKLAGAFRQAQAVANELIGMGVDPQSILVEARAESEAKGGEGDRPRADVFLEN